MRFPCARIDGAALRNNLAVARRLAPRSRVLAVIKANAYGHGLVPAARALATADAFGVARLVEGLTLRYAGVHNTIVLLEGVFSASELHAAASNHFDLVVHSFAQLEMIEQFAGSHRFTVWVKVDTGMNRLGFRSDEFPDAWARLRGCKSVGQLRAMTHFATAEERDNPAAVQQLERFRAVAAQLNVECSIANSAGLIVRPDAHADWVRPGLMLYGISPVPGVDIAALGLQPAMTLLTQLIAIRHVPAGEQVGYGGTWTAQRASKVGIAAIGYGDGYPRNLRTGTPTLIHRRECPLVGRVSMDMTAIDVTDLENVAVGDQVTLWGAGLPADKIAEFADTVAYELVCGISQRVAAEWTV